MSKNKLRKFSDLLTYHNVYQCFDWHDPILYGFAMEEFDLKGKWKKEHFKNDHPITLELACGGGEYTVNLANKFPDRNFIGLDIKGSRIWKGATKAKNAGLDNAAFLRCKIELISKFFEKGEVDEIWITFPDPFLRESKSNRRLTSPYFLGEHRKVLKDGGIIQLKTDDPTLYEFTLETIAEDEKCQLIYEENDIYAKELYIPELEFKTYYEEMHLKAGKKIKYVRFTI